MHELDIDGQAEDKNNIGETVNHDSQSFIGNQIHQGHVGVDQGAHETDRGKQKVGGISSAPEDGKEGQARQDKEAEHRRDYGNIGDLQIFGHRASACLYLFRSVDNRIFVRGIAS